MDIERSEVFRDHFEGCLTHFSRWFSQKSPPRKRGRSAKIKPMMAFCDVGLQTATRWIDNPQGPLPKGECLMKLTCYLDLHGYRIIEFERMPKVIRNFVELIGFGIISADEASNLVGFSKASHLYEVLRCEENLTPYKSTRMFEIWKERRDELETKKREAFKSARLKFLYKVESSQPIEQQVLTLLTPTTSLASRQKSALAIMRGLLGLFNEGLFSNLSSAELVGFENSDRLGIFQLSNHLTVLSSKLIQIEGE